MNHSASITLDQIIINLSTRKHSKHTFSLYILHKSYNCATWLSSIYWSARFDKMHQADSVNVMYSDSFQQTSAESHKYIHPGLFLG